MSQIAHEVSRRITPRYAKERAREMARERVERARDRAVESSWFAPLLGAGIGALVAKTLQSRAQERRWEQEWRWGGDRRGYPGDLEGRRYAYPRPEGLGYGQYEEYEYRVDTRARDEALHGGSDVGQETGSAAREKASELGEKAAAVKESAGRRADELKGRIQEATSSVRERLPDRERIRASTREDTGFWALGAVALGALFGLALPETQREREMLEPARRKARELGHDAREKALEKGSEAMERATEKVRASGGEHAGQASSSERDAPPPGSPAPLH
jgi:hypothetical protein